VNCTSSSTDAVDHQIKYFENLLMAFVATHWLVSVQSVGDMHLPYILESNPHQVFATLNEKS
jgi:hypothetical protein